MTLGLRTYLLSVCAAALFCATAMALLPKGSVRRVAGFTCGLLLTVAAIGPLTNLGDYSISEALAALQMQAEEQKAGVTIKNRELVSQIIKEKTQSYILDKAAGLDMSIQVEVSMEEETGQPYPKSVQITGMVSNAQKAALQDYIEENFGVPAVRQEWISG